MKPTLIELKNICADYARNLVLPDLSLKVEAGEIVALLGASGCGKTTLLKVIAGLVEPMSGTIWFDGENITALAAEKREAVLMFQKPLLFPFLNVAENVGFGLKMRRLPKAEIAEKVREALRLVQLEGFESRQPQQLSGGQEQRVALARALVTNPRVLLLDEPFTALDANLRGEMRLLVKNLQRELKITTIFVTHDQAEALAVADKIAFMDQGQIEQYAAPREFFSNPQTVAAARFFGWKVWAGRQRGNVFETAVGNFALPNARRQRLCDNYLWVGFHPANLSIIEPKTEAASVIAGTIVNIVDLNFCKHCLVQLSDQSTIEIEIPRNAASWFNVGDQISLQIAADSVRFFV